MPGVTVRLPVQAPADGDVLMPLAYELERIARDVRLATMAIEEAQKAGQPIRSDLVAFLKVIAPQIAYRAGQIEADVLIADGESDVG